MTTGKEQCWKFREHLVGSISKGSMQVNGKDLVVRAQYASDMQAKRKLFWRTLDAIKEFGSEDTDFILPPRSFGIHETGDLELMGYVTEEGSVWHDAVVKKAIPKVSMNDLKTVF